MAQGHAVLLVVAQVGVDHLTLEDVAHHVAAVVAAVGDGRDEPCAMGDHPVVPADVALLALGRDHPKGLRHLVGAGRDREEARTARREGGIEGGLQRGAVVGHAVTPCSERRG
jgi:hypothetical protein